VQISSAAWSAKVLKKKKKVKLGTLRQVFEIIFHPSVGLPPASQPIQTMIVGTSGKH
jgi:hypothetical protein